MKKSVHSLSVIAKRPAEDETLRGLVLIAASRLASPCVTIWSKSSRYSVLPSGVATLVAQYVASMAAVVPAYPNQHLTRSEMELSRTIDGREAEAAPSAYMRRAAWSISKLCGLVLEVLVDSEAFNTCELSATFSFW